MKINCRCKITSSINKKNVKLLSFKLLMDPNIVNSNNALALNEKDMEKVLSFTLSPI